MPANQHFDQKHLQEVVLAHSEEIRADRRFSARATLPRPLLALLAIVAIAAISLGIKNYVQEQNGPSPASGTNTPSIDATSRPKKITSAKTRRTRMHAGEADATATPQGDADSLEKPLFSGQFANAGTNAIVAGIGTSTVNGHDAAETAMHENDTTPESQTMGKRSSSTCLPLPNGTNPGDVDAPYYFGWAGEYCGRDMSSASDKAPVSNRSKK